jgi:hypothetical protein
VLPVNKSNNRIEQEQTEVTEKGIALESSGLSVSACGDAATKPKAIRDRTEFGDFTGGPSTEGNEANEVNQEEDGRFEKADLR